MSHKEAGKLGGLATFKKIGVKGMIVMARKGAEAVWGKRKTNKK